MQKFLVVRTDRIGDVLLTLPVVEALKQNFPQAEIAMFVRSYTSELVEGLANVILYDEGSKPKAFFKMINELRKNQFDTAIIAYPRFRIALILWLAGIPIRIGTGYRWYSFLFNKKVFEHRKTVEKHEAEYNLSILKPLGCKLPEKPQFQLKLSQKHRELAIKVRKDLGILDDDNLVVLHPGSGGSAINWKPENFSKLASNLVKKGFEVVVTGSKNEAELVNYVLKKSDEKVKSFISTLSLKEFAAFIQTAKLFVANSTGPLHIAAVVGVPVIGFYPPVKVMSPKRWGPLTERKILFVPDSTQCPHCKGISKECEECMDLIKVDDVVSAAIKLTAGN